MPDYCGARFYSCKADKNAFALMVQRASLYAKLDEITEFPVDERVETHNIYIYWSWFNQVSISFLRLCAFCCPFFFFLELHPSYTSASNTVLLNEFQWMGTKLSLGSALVKLSHWPLNQQACSRRRPLSSPPVFCFLYFPFRLFPLLCSWHNWEQPIKTIHINI